MENVVLVFDEESLAAAASTRPALARAAALAGDGSLPPTASSPRCLPLAAEEAAAAEAAKAAFRIARAVRGERPAG